MGVIEGLKQELSKESDTQKKSELKSKIRAVKQEMNSTYRKMKKEEKAEHARLALQEKEFAMTMQDKES